MCKYQKLSKEYTDFSKKMGLPQERQRIYSDGLGKINMNAPTKANSQTLAKTEPIERSTLTKKTEGSKMKINIQLFAKKVEDFKTIILPKKEYAHVMSEIATNLTREQENKRVFSKAIGDYIYTVENKGFGNYRVIKKIKIDEGM